MCAALDVMGRIAPGACKPGMARRGLSGTMHAIREMFTALEPSTGHGAATRALPTKSAAQSALSGSSPEVNVIRSHERTFRRAWTPIVSQ